ncbi:MAG: glycosyltransferase [Syntrophobacteraceae bacterium]
MRVDLHLHSKYSVRPSQWILQKLGCPESFTEPAELYRIARGRGMDAVTITDHNTIAGSLDIAHLPNTFVSEEVTTYFPDDGCKAHVLVFDIDEKIHGGIQSARENIFDLLKYLTDERIFHILAHPLYAVNDRLTIEHFEKFILMFKNLELNGARDDLQNEAIRRILEGLTPDDIERLVDKHGIVPSFSEPWKKNLTGGSDDHSSLNVARRHTEVPYALRLEEFFSGISAGRAVVRGPASTPRVMSHNLYGIAYQFYKRKLELGKRVNKDLVLRFLDRSLQADAEGDEGLVTRIIYSWRQRKIFKQDENVSRVQDLLRSEAHKLLLDDPMLMEFMTRRDGELGERAEKWFLFANKVSDKVLLHFWDALLGHLSGANFFRIFQTLGSAGALYTVLAPYFVTFSVFSRDRFFSRKTMEHFGIKTKHAPFNGGVFKMAHFTDTLYEVNGVALTLQNHLQIANRTKKDLTLITCDGENRPAKKGVQNFKPIGTFALPEYPEQKLFLPPFLDMLNFCYENEFSALHTATPGPLGLAALAISKILRIPLSGTYHTAIPQYALSMTGDDGIEDLAWKYTLWFYDQLDFIHVPSMATGQELTERGISPDKIKIFPRGVDTERFHPAKRDAALLDRLGMTAATKILYVGRISKEKDLQLLAEAYTKLSRKMSDIQLVLVGDGHYTNELKAMLDGASCVFTGYRDGEELAAIYAGCDLFVFPSATDTFGNVVLEAQASGLPVIVTDSGGPRENVLPGRTGLVVKAGDEESLLDAMESLLADRGRLKEMGKAARLYMEKRSYESAFEQTWLMYRDCGNGKADVELAEAI